MRKNIFMEDKMKKIGFLTVFAAILAFLFAACNDYPSTMEVSYPKAPAPSKVSIELLTATGAGAPTHALLSWRAGGNTSFYEIVRRQVDKNSAQVILTQDPSGNAWDDDTWVYINNPVTNSNSIIGTISNAHTFTLDSTNPLGWRANPKTGANIDTDTYQAIIELRDMLYAAPNGTPYNLGVRAFSQFNNRWSTYSDIQWWDNTVTFRSPPIAELITIVDITNELPAITGTPNQQSLLMSRATERTFIADVTISQGTVKSTENQQINWNIPLFYTDGSNNITTRPVTFSRATINIGGIDRDAITIEIPYNQSTSDSILLTATYSGILTTPTPPLTGNLRVNVSRTPPGLILVNNERRIGRFVAADTGGRLSRWFYFGKPNTGSGDYNIRFFNRPNSIDGLGSVDLLINTNINIRFYDGDGNPISDGGGEIILNATANLTTPEYIVRFTHSDGNYVTLDGTDYPIPATYANVSIQVQNNTPGTPGNFAIDWTSTTPSASE